VYEEQGRDADALAALLAVYPQVERLEPREQAALRVALGRAHHRVGDSERGLEFCLVAWAWFEAQNMPMPSPTMMLALQTIAD
ncbi:hypothetical protein ACR9EG_13345, partial [Lactococcus lactis]|uniref:hypothetical protein n=1 Tax=Lactococcus lactis TaxID=1358 RepID=UPI003EB99217